jgi:sulfide:quinone oxidoreductase
MQKKARLIIIGGGSGGVSMAARMCKHLDPKEIILIEPSDVHYYQPMWTLVGAGLYEAQKTGRPLASILPKGIHWVRDSVEKINPTEKNIVLKSGDVIAFDYLILSSGLELNWSAIKGAKEALGTEGVCSIYDFKQASKTAQMLKNFKGGNALFIMPPVPIKCAGAPQKIMYLAEEIFRELGVREKTKVHFFTYGKAMFGIPIFAQKLDEVATRKGIERHYLHKLVEIKASEKIAVFKVLKEVKTDSKSSTPSTVELHEDHEVEIPYDLIHIVPPMKAHDFVSTSGLAYAEGPQKGWMKTDQHTLQHMDYPYIFGIGDVTGIPNSKTGAAIRAQAPIVEENLVAVIEKRNLTGHYNGYSSCPVVTQKGKVMLAEFGYDSKLLPTFPLDPSQERTSMWILKVYFLPRLYWHGMLKGRA